MTFGERQTIWMWFGCRKSNLEDNGVLAVECSRGGCFILEKTVAVGRTRSSTRDHEHKSEWRRIILFLCYFLKF